jgi:hypothetical protein
MNPESEPGQVHGDPIPVHAVNASPRDLPPKEPRIFDGKIGALSAKCLLRRLPQSRKLGVNLWE